jgi:hypothetical protein
MKTKIKKVSPTGLTTKVSPMYQKLKHHGSN